VVATLVSFVKKSWPQSIAGALMAAPAYLDLSHQAAAWIFYGLGTFGVLGLLFEIWTEVRNPDASGLRKNYRAWAGIAFGAIVLISCGWLFWPSTTRLPQRSIISLQFEKATIPQLGKPTGPIEETDAVYQAAHERAMVVSLLATLDVFIFPYDRKLKAIRQHTTTFLDSRNWFDDAFLRGLFHPPKDKKPPESRMAELWSQNPEQWKWIGWREWSCPFVSQKFYYQRFENGIVFGVFPTSESLGSSQIFAFANNGEWNSTATEVLSAPGCNENTAKVNGIPIHGRFVK
jgi:hypothetical protein